LIRRSLMALWIDYANSLNVVGNQGILEYWE